MAHFMRIGVFNENHGITPRHKLNTTQSAKKVFGELKNIQHTIPKSATKEQHNKQVFGQITASARKNEQRQVAYDLWNDDIFARPCCKENHRKPEEIWNDMNIIDDGKFDALLQMASFAESDEEEIEKPVFRDIEDDLPILGLEPTKFAYNDEDIILPTPEIPSI